MPPPPSVSPEPMDNVVTRLEELDKEIQAESVKCLVNPLQVQLLAMMIRGITMRIKERKDRIPLTAGNSLVQLELVFNQFLHTFRPFTKHESFLAHVLSEGNNTEAFRELYRRIEENACAIMSDYVASNTDDVLSESAEGDQRIINIYVQNIKNLNVRINEISGKVTPETLRATQEHLERVVMDVNRATSDNIRAEIERSQSALASRFDERFVAARREALDVLSNLISEQNNALVQRLTEQSMTQGLLMETAKKIESTNATILTRLDVIQQSMNEGRSTESRAGAVLKIRKRHAIEAQSIILGEKFGEDDAFTWHHGVYAGLKVFVKKIKDNSRESVVRRNFEREVAVLSHIRSPSVLMFLGACFDQQLCCIVHGDVEGILSMPSVPFPSDEREKLEWMEEIANSVAYLHYNRILHGSLSLSAVAFAKDTKSPRLTGFGFGETQSSTLQHFSKATRQDDGFYLAPERFNFDTPHATTAADVFSLGLVLWMIINNRKKLPDYYVPFRSTEHVGRLINDSPAKYQPLLRRCLETNPINRCTAAEACGLVDQLLLPLRRQARDAAAAASATTTAAAAASSPLQSPVTATATAAAASVTPEGAVAPLAAANGALRTARMQLELAADAGSAQAKRLLAQVFYGLGLGDFRRDSARALELLTEAAASDGEAMFLVAKAHLNGEGTPKNIPLALEFFAKARAAGYQG